MNEVMQIGKMVQQFRKGCGLTQVGLGKAIGWKQPAICALERGKRKGLDIRDVKKIAGALQIPPQRLLYSMEWEETGEAATNTSALLEQLGQLDAWQQQKLLKAVIEIASAMKGKSSNDNN